MFLTFLKNNLLKLSLIILFFSVFKVNSYADEKSYPSKVTRIVEEKQVELMGTKQLYQKLEVTVTAGDKKGEVITILNGDQPLANVTQYKLNDRVLITTSTDPEGNQTYYISDFIRNDGLILLLIIFIVLTVFVAKWKGLSSIISLVFTFFILFIYVLPQISSGHNPILVASLASLIIIPITFYLSHGFNQKTTIAIIGSLIALIVTGILSSVFIELTHLTGLSSEEAGMLLVDRNGSLNMKGLLLAGIVIGTLGVLDDITVSQAAIVNELAGNVKSKDLYSKAMSIGKDHITSMVNTLVLAYAGASLPLLLMFIDNPHPFSEIVNYEMIAEEIVRTLIGSIGLILAVPVTTLIAANWYKNKQK